MAAQVTSPAEVARPVERTTCDGTHPRYRYWATLADDRNVARPPAADIRVHVSSARAAIAVDDDESAIHRRRDFSATARPIPVASAGYDRRLPARTSTADSILNAKCRKDRTLGFRPSRPITTQHDVHHRAERAGQDDVASLQRPADLEPSPREQEPQCRFQRSGQAQFPHQVLTRSTSPRRLISMPQRRKSSALYGPWRWCRARIRRSTHCRPPCRRA